MGKKFIDVEAVIRDKNPALLKWLPGFILSYIKKILHQDDINQFIDAHKHLYGYDFCDAIIKYWEIKVEAQGLENVPKVGGAVFASNHPLGGMDAIALVHALSNHRKDIKFIVNDILMQIENLKGMFVGINKIRTSASTPLNEVHELFETDQAIFIFPAGLVSRKKKGKIEDPEWRKTFVTRSRLGDKMVVPVYLEGKLSNFFYNLANLRTSLGIKANIEMFYLVHELYKQRGRTIRITFGEPIKGSSFDKTHTDKEWAQIVKKKVYELSR